MLRIGEHVPTTDRVKFAGGCNLINMYFRKEERSDIRHHTSGDSDEDHCFDIRHVLVLDSQCVGVGAWIFLSEFIFDIRVCLLVCLSEHLVNRLRVDSHALNAIRIGITERIVVFQFKSLRDQLEPCAWRCSTFLRSG